MDETTNETATEAQAEAAPEAKKPGEKINLTINGGVIQTLLGDAFPRSQWPEFDVGDTIKVHYKIKEGDKERVQVYEGTVITFRGEGHSTTFNVRRISHEIGVERIFPYHSPYIAKIEVTRRGKVRRGRLYYLRHKSGKEGRIRESYSAETARRGQPAKG
ncbi:MAG: 50S ribosomal protein L19 [Spirochaetia bacterium]|nr:50S ribosomal protein L19 [Spirochaetia bacterium]